ncbi:MAG: hypothetical protein LBM38_03610 [Clostridiales bacterium]|jgi:hypothetical protein|nr:hypothetical protein [Clostridiales bacterium]
MYEENYKQLLRNIDECRAMDFISLDLKSYDFDIISAINEQLNSLKTNERLLIEQRYGLKDGVCRRFEDIELTPTPSHASSKYNPSHLNTTEKKVLRKLNDKITKSFIDIYQKNRLENAFNASDCNNIRFIGITSLYKLKQKYENDEHFCANINLNYKLSLPTRGNLLDYIRDQFHPFNDIKDEMLLSTHARNCLQLYSIYKKSDLVYLFENHPDFFNRIPGCGVVTSSEIYNFAEALSKGETPIPMKKTASATKSKAKIADKLTSMRDEKLETTSVAADEAKMPKVVEDIIASESNLAILKQIADAANARIVALNVVK